MSGPKSNATLTVGALSGVVESLVPILEQRSADHVSAALEQLIPIVDQRAADITASPAAEVATRARPRRSNRAGRNETQSEAGRDAHSEIDRVCMIVDDLVRDAAIRQISEGLDPHSRDWD